MRRNAERNATYTANPNRAYIDPNREDFVCVVSAFAENHAAEIKIGLEGGGSTTKNKTFLKKKKLKSSRAFYLKCMDW